MRDIVRIDRCKWFHYHKVKDMLKNKKSIIRVQPPKLTFYDRLVLDIIKKNPRIGHSAIIEKFSKQCGERLRSKGAVRFAADRSLSKLFKMKIIGRVKSDEKDRRITFYYPTFSLPISSTSMIKVIKEYLMLHPEARFEEILQLFPGCPDYVLFFLTSNLFNGTFLIEESGQIVFSNHSKENCNNQNAKSHLK